MRFTPTPAGTTGSTRRRDTARSVHPRRRGDHAGVAAVKMAGDGSPPRLRGPSGFQIAIRATIRFTPTRVGTTRGQGLIVGPPPVHPRARGEHLPLTTVPLARSTVHPRVCGDHGALPTFAWTDYAVHPHTRGDDATVNLTVLTNDGSPPCGWGQPVRLAAPVGEDRFTPAHAGTIAVGRRAGALTTVHPHTRGDDRLLLSGDFGQLGSPPRTRGQLQPAARVLHVRRFTPTRVGTTHREFAEAHGRSVHPRTRGDNFHAHLRLPTWSPVVC